MLRTAACHFACACNQLEHNQRCVQDVLLTSSLADILNTGIPSTSMTLHHHVGHTAHCGVFIALLDTAEESVYPKASAVFLLQFFGSAHQPPAGDQTPAYAFGISTHQSCYLHALSLSAVQKTTFGIGCMSVTTPTHYTPSDSAPMGLAREQQVFSAAMGAITRRGQRYTGEVYAHRRSKLLG